jgi:hypothetical protein
MKRITTLLFALGCVIFNCLQTTAQKLPARWDEITAADWNNALVKSNKTCILPIGILEKHGPHVPMGSDLIRVREYASRATQKEYAVVFPDYFYGQINEAKHQPGVFALPERVVWDMLEHTCDEIARNGFNKIIIVNGHGGNPELIKYFIQTRLEKERNYAVYFFQPSSDSAFSRQQAACVVPMPVATSMPVKKKHRKYCISVPTWCNWTAPKMNPVKTKTGYPYQMCTQASGGMQIIQIIMQVKAIKPQQHLANW